MSRERVIGLVLSYCHSYYRRILEGIIRYADRHPEWHFVSVAPAISRPVRELLKDVDAAIMGVCTPQWRDFVQRTRARVVNVDCVVPGLPMHRVGVDNQQVGALAAQHFMERGLRSFAFVGNPRFLFSIERRNGFRKGLEAAGYKLAVYNSNLPKEYDVTGSAPQLDGRIKRWLAALPLPCGILVAADSLAPDLMRYSSEAKLRVPEDLAILGVDNDDLYCEICRPRLSSIVSSAEAIGFRAAQAAEQLIRSNTRYITQEILIPPQGLIVRRSTEVLAIDDADVVTAVRFIRENCHRTITVMDVLQKVPLSRRALERRFQDSLGMTLGGEIRRTRLERAKQLLAETDMSIAEVAVKSGFKDFRHLCVTFRLDLQQTPTQYRRSTSTYRQ